MFGGASPLTYDDTNNRFIMAPRSVTFHSIEDVYLIELGPVAGGVEALSAVLSGLRPKAGVSYLISTGFLPDKASGLYSLISRASSMPVVRVRNGIRIQPKCIYVSPPSTHVKVERRKIWLTPRLETGTQSAAPAQAKPASPSGSSDAIPNRALLCQRLQQACKQYRRNHRKVSLLLLEPSFPEGAPKDRTWKETVMLTLARRLESRIRETDILARVGESSLGILVRDFYVRDEVRDLAGRLIHAFEEPFPANGESLLLRVNIGIALHPDDSHSVNGMFQIAEQTLAAAKNQGENTFRFDEGKGEAANERYRLGEQLQAWLDSGQLTPVYQPIIELTSGRVTGAEALLRLRDQSRLSAPPSRIVEIAEECGMIHQLGDRVLSQVCRQIRKWDAAGIPPIHVAVNLSATQLGADGASKSILRHLQKHDIAPQRLRIEITESVLLERSELARQELSELHKAGLSLVLDDFGTGYCSLTYLRQFPVRCLKVDLSFVHGVGTGSNDEEIIAAMIGLAHALGIGVVAEGVETGQQAAFLRRQHCDMAQGFYFAKPMTADEFAEFILRNPTVPLDDCEAAVCDA
jgi:diguanylate cyclase (GGDEF)-like protein